MPSTYTTNNGFEKIATGEKTNAWGTTERTTLDLIDESLEGQVTITLPSAGTTGSPNTFSVVNGASSTGRHRFVEVSDGGDLGATAYLQLTPNDAEKITYFRNSLSGNRTLTVFQGDYASGRKVDVPNGGTLLLKFDGQGASSATVSSVFPRMDEISGITPSDGVLIVGDGTNFVGESGATARNSLGLGTASTPTLGGVTISGTSTLTKLTVSGSTTLAAGLDLTGAGTFNGTTTFYSQMRFRQGSTTFGFIGGNNTDGMYINGGGDADTLDIRINGTSRALFDAVGMEMGTASTTSTTTEGILFRVGASGGNPLIRIKRDAATDNDAVVYELYRGTTREFAVRADGDVQNTNNSYGAISDGRMKDIIGPLTPNWETAKMIEFWEFMWKNDPDAGVQEGVIAQKLLELGLDRYVSEDEKGTLSVKYSKLYLYFMPIVQQIMGRVEDIERRLSVLENA